jgi:hypothetical protein
VADYLQGDRINRGGGARALSEFLHVGLGRLGWRAIDADLSERAHVAVRILDRFLWCRRNLGNGPFDDADAWFVHNVSFQIPPPNAAPLASPPDQRAKTQGLSSRTRRAVLGIIAASQAAYEGSVPSPRYFPRHKA